jgi:hypothetical protein
MSWTTQNSGQFGTRGQIYFGENETNTFVMFHPTLFNRRLIMCGTAAGLTDVNMQAYEFHASGNGSVLSDMSVKENVQPLNEVALDVVRAVPVRKWTPTPPNRPAKRGFQTSTFVEPPPVPEQIGWVAQEVPARARTAFPTEEGQDELLAIVPNVLLAYLWKAVQELAAQVDALRGPPPR